MLRTLTDPDWNGWKYDYYDNTPGILSYPEWGYEINVGELPKGGQKQAPCFYMKNHFALLLQKRWMTDEIYEGLAKACEVVVKEGIHAVAVEVQRQYKESTKID